MKPWLCGNDEQIIEAPVVPPATSRSTTQHGELWDVPTFLLQKSQKACSETSESIRTAGLTSCPWQSGRSLTWDVIVVDTPQANSYTSTGSVHHAERQKLPSRWRKRSTPPLATHTHILCPLPLRVWTQSTQMANASWTITANTSHPFPVTREKPPYYTREYLYFLKFSIWSHLAVLFFAETLTKV